MKELLILLEVVLFPQRSFCFFFLMDEEALEARAKVNVPAPETTSQRRGIPVVMCAKLAVFTGVLLLCHNGMLLLPQRAMMGYLPDLSLLLTSAACYHLLKQAFDGWQSDSVSPNARFGASRH